MNSASSIAAILLTGILGAKPVEGALSYTEFNRLKNAFAKEGYTVGDLLEAPLWQLLEFPGVDKKRAEKLYKLVQKREEIEQIAEQLERENIRIITTGSYDYPIALSEKLPELAPPTLFTIGDKELLCGKAVAVTGSRDTSEASRHFANIIGGIIAAEGKVLVSGGARGCDFLATKSAIESGGSAVWFAAVPFSNFLRDPLITAWVAEGNLCITTDVSPASGFNRENALRRNLYIYALAKTSFVCECKSRISGTYSGAIKCLKNNLSELYVFDCGGSGSKMLIKNGGKSLAKYT